MIRAGSSDRDTGFGTGNSSYREDSLQQRRAPSPEMVFQNGRHVYQDVRYGRHKEGNILVITVVTDQSIIKLFGHCIGGNFNIHISAWFYFLIC